MFANVIISSIIQQVYILSFWYSLMSVVSSRYHNNIFREYSSAQDLRNDRSKMPLQPQLASLVHVPHNSAFKYTTTFHPSTLFPVQDAHWTRWVFCFAFTDQHMVQTVAMQTALTMAVTVMGKEHGGPYMLQFVYSYQPSGCLRTPTLSHALNNSSAGSHTQVSGSSKASPLLVVLVFRDTKISVLR